MRLASVVVTRSVTWCGLPKAGSCSRRRCSATAAYSGDSRRSLRIVRDDLMHYEGAAISQAAPCRSGMTARSGASSWLVAMHKGQAHPGSAVGTPASVQYGCVTAPQKLVAGATVTNGAWPVTPQLAG